MCVCVWTFQYFFYCNHLLHSLWILASPLWEWLAIYCCVCIFTATNGRSTTRFFASSRVEWTLGRQGEILLLMQHLDSNLVVQIRPDCPMILFIFIPDHCTPTPSLICVSTVCLTLGWAVHTSFIHTPTHIHTSTYLHTCVYMYLFLSDFIWSVPRLHYTRVGQSLHVNFMLLRRNIHHRQKL